jgi:hypothetical protein
MLSDSDKKAYVGALIDINTKITVKNEESV